MNLAIYRHLNIIDTLTEAEKLSDVEKTLLIEQINLVLGYLTGLKKGLISNGKS